MDTNLIAVIERLGSFGLVAWLVIWATTKAWPKVRDHLDDVRSAIRTICEELQLLGRELRALRHDFENRLPAAPAPPPVRPPWQQMPGGELRHNGPPEQDPVRSKQ